MGLIVSHGIMKNHTGKPQDGGWTGSWNAKHNPPANTSHILQWLANTTPLKSPRSAAGFAAGSPIAGSDGDGLTFTLTDNSTAPWVLRYSRGSRRRELTLGSYLELALSEARKKTRMYRVRIDAGENTEGIYDVREELPERREAMEAWARFIERCCIETPPQNQERPDDVLQSNVTPFRQRSAA